jgi:flagellar hook protein FlgE
MGLNTFSTALSGLDSSTMGLNVVGNNLANLNTVGFKESDISFSEVLGQQFSTPGGNMNSIGLGSQVQAVRAQFSQGGVQTSNNPLDVAIQGSGMLVLNDNGTRLYTRAGNMHLDSNGNLVSGGGGNVQGYQLDPTTGLINKSGGVSDIVVPNNLVSPTATTQFDLGMNLDASAATGSTFSTTVQIFDSNGTAHNATLSMVKDISGGATPVTRWRFDMTIPANEVAGAAPTATGQFSLLTGAAATASPAAGALVFNGNGVLTSAYLGADPATNPPLGNLTIPPGTVTLPALGNGGTLSPMTWNLVSASGTPNVSGFASTSAVTSSNQNGAVAGTLSSMSIQSNGTLSAVFNNGKTIDIAQLVLAQFSDFNGLTPQGNGLFTESTASGTARIGAPEDAGQGKLMSGSLELSNVDLATELTKIITFQRGYQANAKMITTADQIMQDTLNIKQ